MLTLFQNNFAEKLLRFVIVKHQIAVVLLEVKNKLPSRTLLKE